MDAAGHVHIYYEIVKLELVTQNVFRSVHFVIQGPMAVVILSNVFNYLSPFRCVFDMTETP